MNNIFKAGIIFVIVFSLLSTFGIVYFQNEIKNSYKDSCQKHGGDVVFSGEHWVCLKGEKV